MANFRAGPMKTEFGADWEEGKGGCGGFWLRDAYKVFSSENFPSWYNRVRAQRSCQRVCLFETTRIALLHLACAFSLEMWWQLQKATHGDFLRMAPETQQPHAAIFSNYQHDRGAGDWHPSSLVFIGRVRLRGVHGQVRSACP